VLAVAAVGVALVRAIREAGEVPLPAPKQLAASAVLAAVAVTIAGVAWAVLLAGPAVNRVLPGFLLAQLAKYLPGSVWQGVSQVLYAESLGLSRSRTSLRFLLQLWTQLIAAALVSGLALVASTPWWLLLLPAGALALLPTLHRGVLVQVSAGLVTCQLLRRSRRLAGLPGAIPEQRPLLVAWLLGGLTILAAGLSYVILLPGVDSSAQLAAAVGAFAAAWVVGFLVVPLPAGVGIREFVLVALLGSTVGTAPVLTAAVAHRAVTLVAEAALALLTVGSRRGDPDARTDGQAGETGGVDG